MKRKLLFFHAVWCQPCKNMSAILDIAQIPEDVEIVGVDVQDEECLQLKLMKKYAIKKVPTLIYLENGIEMWRYAGIMHDEDLEKKFI